MQNKKKDNRKEKRVRIEIPATYTFNGIEASCLILDVGTTGIAMKAHQILLPGDTLYLRFHIKKYGDIASKIVVRYMKGTRVGCQFVDIDNVSKHAVDSFLSQHSGFDQRRVGSF